jgi:hypothetical protein
MHTRRNAYKKKLVNNPERPLGRLLERYQESLGRPLESYRAIKNQENFNDNIDKSKPCLDLSYTGYS